MPVEPIRHENDVDKCSRCETMLLTAHADLVGWYRKIKKKYVNVHISCSFRNQAEQNKSFAEGKSRLAWPSSKHNNMEDKKPCSKALDLFLLDEDGLARFPPLFYAKLNADNEKEDKHIIWGGKWKSLKDLDHFEIK